MNLSGAATGTCSVAVATRPEGASVINAQAVLVCLI